MDRRKIFLSLCACVLAGCSGISVSVEQETMGERFYDIVPACDQPDFIEKTEEILASLKVRLCDGAGFVLETQSMSTSQDFRYVDQEQRWEYGVQLLAAGGRCTTDDGCEMLSRDECTKAPDCTPIVAVYALKVAEGDLLVPRTLAEISIDTWENPSVTEEDMRKTMTMLRAENCRFFFHVGSVQHELSGDGCEAALYGESNAL